MCISTSGISGPCDGCKGRPPGPQILVWAPTRREISHSNGHLKRGICNKYNFYGRIEAIPVRYPYVRDERSGIRVGRTFEIAGNPQRTR